MRVHHIFILAVMAIFFVSCNDDPAKIASDIFGDNLIETDISVSTENDLNAQKYTVGDVDFNIIDYLMLGEYNDPRFGNIKADFLCELSLGDVPPTRELNYADTVEYVSTEFRIQYSDNSWLGDTVAMHKFSVYKLNKRMDPDFDYNSNYNLPSELYDSSNSIGENSFYIKNSAVDTLWKEPNYIHTLAIDIKDEVGLEIFNADSATITNSEKFRDELCNGIYVTTSKEDEKAGSVLRLNYRNIHQELAVIYRIRKILKDINDIDSIAYDTLAQTFPVSNGLPIAIRYNNDYSNIDNNPNTDKIYLQGMGGTMAKISIQNEFINNWKNKLNENNDKTISIASVNLSFYIDSAYIDTTKTDFEDNIRHLPNNLVLYSKNESDEFITPVFDVSESSASVPIFSTGVISEDSGLKYTFTLSNGFFEEFINPTLRINEERNYKEFYLGIPDPDFSFNRVVLQGMSTSNMTVKYVEL